MNRGPGIRGKCAHCWENCGHSCHGPRPRKRRTRVKPVLRCIHHAAVPRLRLRPLSATGTEDLVAYRSLDMIARVDARNEASLRLGERLGRRREARLVSNEWFNGAWSDEVDLAVLDSEWAVQHAAGQRSCPWPLACRSGLAYTWSYPVARDRRCSPRETDGTVACIVACGWLPGRRKGAEGVVHPL